MLENKAEGLFDYAQSFTVQLSQRDFERVAYDIRSAPNFTGFVVDLSDIPMAQRDRYDTVNAETQHFLEREYFTKEKQPDGTYHFIFQLDKVTRQLQYLGINE